MSGFPRVTKDDLTVPNAISAFRLLLIPVFVVLISRHQDLAALIVVAVSSVSDWLDGFIARRFNQVSELGKVLDPIADRWFIFVTFIALVLRGEVPWWLMAIVLFRDLVMLILVTVVARAGHKPMAVTYIGKAATLCLLVALPMFILAALTSESGSLAEVSRTIAWIFASLGAVLYWLSAFQYFRKAAKIFGSREPAVSES